jgi:glycosyltransferase involved in cell wall biosynthesis
VNLVNLHIYPSPFKYETRILKETKSIIKLNLVSQVLILSTGEHGLSREEWVEDRIKVRRINTLSQSLFPGSKAGKGLLYVEFYLRALVFGLSNKIHIINCHSLMVLPLSVILKLIKGAKLIYDPHELETERLGLKGSAQKVSKWIERKLIGYCDALIVVSDSIKKWYENTYQLQDVVSVVRNIPNYAELEPQDVLRKNFEIPTDHLVFIYQGLLNEGRSIDLYLNTFVRLPEHYHLLIMGYGGLVRRVEKYAKQYKNIHFQPAVKPDEILKYTSSADIGLSLIENCCLSYYFCLPNKFFEYLMAGLPVIVSDFPDMATLIRSYEAGWAVGVNEKDLFDLVRSIDQTQITAKRLNIKRMKKQFTWEKEEIEFKKVYKSLHTI